MKVYALRAVMASLILLPVSDAQAATGTVKVQVAVKSDGGKVVCALFADQTGFPMKQNKAEARSVVAPKSKKATCTFKAISAGTYAVSAFHDENGNGELDTNWVGMPKEAVGASNNAKGTMGPPSFKDASFPVSADGASIAIRLR